MIILDTNILSLLQRDDSVESRRIRARVAELPREERVCMTVITYEEQFRGWMAYVAKARTHAQQVHAYELLYKHFAEYRSTDVVEFEARAVSLSHELRKTYRRIGLMDIRIAAIALEHGALLISQNLIDFGQIAKLRVEDWTLG
ncbi:MAG TPA: PIN domain-containing protein [Phycisphaerae bacterium]|nr:PIN domain-containing protein [Phycisphaerae bacterium]